MVKLAVREIPVVTFRRALPAYLAGGEPAFIEINARAAGAVNPAYTAGSEALLIRVKVAEAKAAAILDAAERAEARHAMALEIAEARFALLFDACVIDWRSNILDDGKPIKTTPRNLVELVKARDKWVADALRDFERECLAAGEAILKADGETLGN